MDLENRPEPQSKKNPEANKQAEILANDLLAVQVLRFISLCPTIFVSSIALALLLLSMQDLPLGR